MIAVLIFFLAANEENKYDENNIKTRQRRESVTLSDAIVREIDTQKKKTGTGHRQDRDKRAIIVTTAHNGSA